MSDNQSAETISVETVPTRCNEIDTALDVATFSELSETTASLPADKVDEYAEKELAMVFEFSETCRGQGYDDQLGESDDEDSVGASSQGLDEFTDSQDLIDPLINDEASDQLPVTADRNIFHCTLPVVVRQRLEMEAKGINAARRKQRQMVVYNSDCSTLSSCGVTKQPSFGDTGSTTCGCFRLLRLPIGAVRTIPVSSTASPTVTLGGRTIYNRSVISSNNKSDDRRQTLISLVTIGHRTQTYASPPSAVQTFSFADTKIGNAVSAVSGTDGGLVVRVNSCRGGQHLTSDKHGPATAASGVRGGNVLSLITDGQRNKPSVEEGPRWRTTKSSEPGSDSTGNFTLVPRRCTEVRRGLSRRRWQQQTSSSPNNEHLSGNDDSKQRRSSRRKHHLQSPQPDNLDDEDAASSAALTTVQSGRRRSKFGDSSSGTTSSINSVISSAATAAWRRLVAGFGFSADDGRRVFANCRHNTSSDGLCVGLLGRTSGRSYDLLTN